jgi:hypothetical protein
MSQYITKSICNVGTLTIMSERMLHKEYDSEFSVEKRISGREPQGA